MYLQQSPKNTHICLFADKIIYKNVNFFPKASRRSEKICGYEEETTKKKFKNIYKKKIKKKNFIRSVWMTAIS